MLDLLRDLAWAVFGQGAARRACAFASESYRNGERHGAEAERAKVRWLEGKAAVRYALVTGLDLERGERVGAACAGWDHPSVHTCLPCTFLDRCWRLRPNVRVGVAIEEGE